MPVTCFLIKPESRCSDFTWLLHQDEASCTKHEYEAVAHEPTIKMQANGQWAVRQAGDGTGCITMLSA